MPTIDIALASYNGEKFIRDQIGSILSNRIELAGFALGSIIVSDNMSTDQTATIVSEIASEHPNVKLYLNSLRGVVKNFGNALAHTTADYVMLSDQDDIWLDEKIQMSLQKLLELERDSGSDVPLLVFSDLAVTNSELEITHPSFFKSQNINPKNFQSIPNIFLSNVAAGCTMIVNRKLLEIALPLPAEAIVHDWWLILIASVIGRVAYIETPTILYRQHENNQIGAPTQYYRQIFSRPMTQFALEAQRLLAASKQAKAFREKIKKIPLGSALTIDFLADFERLSRRERLRGLCQKKLIHKTLMRTLNLFILAVTLPRSK
ncbi:glycosyltransferase family 2 protein [Undibacterium sp. SXout20W]|uniref:glycosyltransferase family 2 protein n=1 Tax=Undibacterium sp. SXout20W TaxID=3413051 RepID=UPI003BF29172